MAKKVQLKERGTNVNIYPVTTKEAVGLNNVDNTSDANKPVSIAQATAIADAKKELKAELGDVDRKIDAKVIEAGGVPFDLKPTKDSQNAVFSGGIHKYIEDKFVVMTEDEYNELVIKDANTFYFILE